MLVPSVPGVVPVPLSGAGVDGPVTLAIPPAPGIAVPPGILFPPPVSPLAGVPAVVVPIVGKPPTVVVPPFVAFV